MLSRVFVVMKTSIINLIIIIIIRNNKDNKDNKDNNTNSTHSLLDHDIQEDGAVPTKTHDGVPHSPILVTAMLQVLFDNERQHDFGSICVLDFVQSLVGMQSCFACRGVCHPPVFHHAHILIIVTLDAAVDIG